MPRPRPTPAGVAERLQKYLAQRGLGSRRGIEEWIRAQRVTVNGRIAELGQKVTHHDDIRLDGRPIRTRAAAAAQFHLQSFAGDPLRVSTAERQALIERLPKNAGRRFIAVSPMPGVDGGLELVTSDGALAAKLQRAIHKLPSEFSVRVMGLLGPDQLAGVKPASSIGRRACRRATHHQRSRSRRRESLVRAACARRERQGHPPAFRKAGRTGEPRAAGCDRHREPTRLCHAVSSASSRKKRLGHRSRRPRHRNPTTMNRWVLSLAALLLAGCARDPWTTRSTRPRAMVHRCMAWGAQRGV